MLKIFLEMTVKDIAELTWGIYKELCWVFTTALIFNYIAYGIIEYITKS